MCMGREGVVTIGESVHYLMNCTYAETFSDRGEINRDSIIQEVEAGSLLDRRLPKMYVTDMTQVLQDSK